MKKLFVVTTATAALIATAANAGSYNTFEANGNAFVARSMEAPMTMQERLAVFPRGYDLHGVNGSIGYIGIQHGSTEWVSSGLNEHGLNVESLALIESKYVAEGEGDVNYLGLVSHVLANAKSVEQAIALLKKTKVETTTIAVAHGSTVGMHFAIRDNQRAIVIEYLDGSGYPSIFENHLGAMTNDPNYAEMEQLAAEVFDADGASVRMADYQLKLSEKTFKGFDKTSTDRFLQSVSMNYVEDLRRVKTDLDAVNRAWTIVNSMEIVEGSLYWRWIDQNPQMVGYGTVVDLKKKDYYFRTMDNMNIRKIDVDRIDFSTVEYKAASIYGSADYQQYRWQ
ncbi:choloylglycine hydrolase [Agarivorans sp. Toyoura001]|uniref:linear amide C-N hydrolase n=1 Tax=Agarivorans sp. Toyoura001 TaxID=2283141 RepID=UPI0010DADC04|nr:linear amide C-N hydrolase [Agarivorans sp. Toyoura001]GDY25900.1 choloylglycine hydrolase [Agarivorans sp. Toyoura001]